jgi:hypothetical protein
MLSSYGPTKTFNHHSWTSISSLSGQTAVVIPGLSSGKKMQIELWERLWYSNRICHHLNPSLTSEPDPIVVFRGNYSLVLSRNCGLFVQLYSYSTLSTLKALANSMHLIIPLISLSLNFIEHCTHPKGASQGTSGW